MWSIDSGETDRTSQVSGLWLLTPNGHGWSQAVLSCVCASTLPGLMGLDRDRQGGGDGTGRDGTGRDGRRERERETERETRAQFRE